MMRPARKGRMQISLLGGSIVLSKTAHGRTVIRERLDVVSVPERAMLILVDGKTSIEQLRSFYSCVKADDNTFEKLLAKGLIEILTQPKATRVRSPESVFVDEPAEQFDDLYLKMVTICASFLGLRGYFLQLRIERCYSLSELETLQSDLIRAIAKRHGDQVARSVNSRLDGNDDWYDD